MLRKGSIGVTRSYSSRPFLCALDIIYQSWSGRLELYSVTCLLKLYSHLLCSHTVSNGDKSRNAEEDSKKERAQGKGRVVQDSPSNTKLELGFDLTCN